MPTACTVLIFALCVQALQVPIAPPPRERAITNADTFFGEVLSVNNRSITIRGKTERATAEAEIIRRFAAGVELGRGEQTPTEKSAADYRLSDVKVGDIVYIKIHVYNEDHLCVSVRIERRPKGEVPKAPFEESEVQNPYHEMMNAYQRFEEKGIPLPLKYNRDYQRAVREAQAIQDSKAQGMENAKKMLREGRIAPPPRPVIRK